MTTDAAIHTTTELREFMGEPAGLAVAKAIDHLDQYCREFIVRSPFLCLGTSDAEGHTDVSPRGDQPGFVQILDDHTLFIPERPGNKRADSLSNITVNPEVGLLFLVPGFDDCLRVNGHASVVREPTLLERATVRGRTPALGIKVSVREAYLHCAKAIRRSSLWDSDARQDRSALPSIGRMILEQTATEGTQPEPAVVSEVDALIEDNYKNELY